MDISFIPGVSTRGLSTLLLHVPCVELTLVSKKPQVASPSHDQQLFHDRLPPFDFLRTNRGLLSKFLQVLQMFPRCLQVSLSPTQLPSPRRHVPQLPRLVYQPTLSSKVHYNKVSDHTVFFCSSCSQFAMMKRTRQRMAFYVCSGV